MPIILTNVAKTLIWTHEYDVKLLRLKERTPNTNDHHIPLKDPPVKFFCVRHSFGKIVNLIHGKMITNPLENLVHLLSGNRHIQFTHANNLKRVQHKNYSKNYRINNALIFEIYENNILSSICKSLSISWLITFRLITAAIDRWPEMRTNAMFTTHPDLMRFKMLLLSIVSPIITKHVTETARYVDKTPS